MKNKIFLKKKKAFQVSNFVPFWTHMCPFSKKLVEIKIKIIEKSDLRLKILFKIFFYYKNIKKNGIKNYLIPNTNFLINKS